MLCKIQSPMHKISTFDCSPLNIKAAVKAARREQFNELSFDFKKKIRKVRKFGPDIPTQLKELDLLIRQEYEKIEDNWIAESWILNNHPDLEETSAGGTQRLVKFIESFAKASHWAPDVEDSIREFIYSYRMIVALEGWKEKINPKKPKKIASPTIDEAYISIFKNKDHPDEIVDIFRDSGCTNESGNWGKKYVLFRDIFFYLKRRGIFLGDDHTSLARAFANKFNIELCNDGEHAPGKYGIKNFQPNSDPGVTSRTPYIEDLFMGRLFN